ncbi:MULTISPECIES: DUF4389 domain-containing protein [unclassified Amycolatopsis]|uniref:DUF4389 domain-containing protein n=1 Tax=unclassified Amycolatopsis TaxID=2618356 RepID=UPI002874EB0A|nr:MULTISPECIES: DUF4389 domain-containing protein [unclassified Amycolatopsis]MDS0134712.1 DUF4389 domain-containing protein [Amycolatopsis sp. 505]MDS0147389.1 DUF4389 domain-containing protein [Amycolatopsis sp. CM201R]
MTEYPVRVEATLDEPLSRGLWLVKWLLAVPHYIVLAFLWFAYPFATIAAFFAILVTGRYPRPQFEFTSGVLRWSWRVQYYSYAALGTDRYPPFTLADVPDYPARLEIAYPERLSRGLVLVKWWLLAIPHFIVVGLFVGGGTWLASRTSDGTFDWAAGGLVGVLVLVAGVVLLFTGRYPRPIFDFVLGMDRWVLRVAAYVSLMTDEYPPFRLDMGGAEAGHEPPHPQPPHPHASGWTAGRIAAAITGAVLVLGSMGLVTGGAAVLWADRTQRDADGYLTASTTFVSGGYAVATDPVRLEGVSVPKFEGFIGDVRIRVTDTAGRPVFVGIGRTADVERYLAATEYTTPGNRTHPGGALAVSPGDAGVWVASASGAGTQTVTWPVLNGQWTAVVMNADAARGISVRAEAGATAPALGWIALALLVSGLVVLAGGVVLIGVAAHRASHRPNAAEPSTVDA